MWTLAGMRDNMTNCVTIAPRAGRDEKLPGRLFRAMSHKKCSGLIRLCMLLAVALTLGVPASAEWKEKVLHSFQGGANDGSDPAGGVIFDAHGNLYGATTGGGPASCGPIAGECGTVFQLTPPAQKGGSWTETLIYQFKGKGSNDASVPNGGLILDASGNLYGVTAYGGTGDCVLLGVKAGCGTVYELSPPSEKSGTWTETILYSFPTARQGYLPNGNLVFDSAGNLYGATQFGGGHGTTCNGFYQYCGAIFELSPPKTKGREWTEKVVYGFKGVAPGKQFGDGANPNGALVLDSKGTIYGTTFFGGNNVKGECQGGAGGTGCGIVFELTAPSQKGGRWTKKVLHQFDGKDGANSAAGVIFDGSGNLYGTTLFGPPHGFGLIFELKKPTGRSHLWTEAVLHAFSDGNDGAGPMAGLTFDPRGSLYSTAYRGSGGSQYGDVFRLQPPSGKHGHWAFTVLYGFSGSLDAAQPAAALVFDRAGNLYGTSQYGGTGTGCGTGACGTVFEVSP
jgi:hypothetical protein